MHFISLGNDDFSAFLFIKGNIKRIKKARQTNSYRFKERAEASKYLGAATGVLAIK
ncbi:hypothetical protein NEOC84_000068|nr:hypothetical protein [Neochlamydia sp. AcF84]